MAHGPEPIANSSYSLVENEGRARDDTQREGDDQQAPIQLNQPPRGGPWTECTGKSVEWTSWISGLAPFPSLVPKAALRPKFPELRARRRILWPEDAFIDPLLHVIQCTQVRFQAPAWCASHFLGNPAPTPKAKSTAAAARPRPQNTGRRAGGGGLGLVRACGCCRSRGFFLEPFNIKKLEAGMLCELRGAL